MSIMKRRILVPFTVVAAVVVSLVFSGYTGSRDAKSGGRAQPQKPLSVLFIAVDDLRPELGSYGSSHIKSPNIDALARSGLIFNRAYCQQAVCSPSRTSLLTGLRPDATQVYDLQTHFRQNVPDVVTLPQHFKDNGYFTKSLGKIYHSGLDDAPSWSEPSWHPKTKSVRGYVLPENIALARNNQTRGPATEIAVVPDEAYEDGMIADKAIETLRAVKDKPFFLAVGFLKPHLPFNAPKKYWDLYDPGKIQLPEGEAPEAAPRLALTNFGELRNYADIPKQGPLSQAQAVHLVHGYYACVSYMDAQVGRVMNELKRLGLDKNTMVVLWGDHGFKLGEYGEWCKHTNFEIDTRSPLIVSTPTMKAKGKKTSALVEFVDIYPTLCQEAGLPLPAHLQGISFSPLLNAPQTPWKKAAFSQYPRPTPEGEVMGYTMRTDRYRYTSWQSKNNPTVVVAEELYDHKTDPGEKFNVAAKAEYAQEIQVLRKALAEGKASGLSSKQ